MRDTNIEQTASLSHKVFLCLWLLTGLSACTTAAPEQDKSQVQKESTKLDPITLKRQALDKAEIERSIFVNLSKDAKEVIRWEQSDAWIKYYQGQLHEALDAFEAEVNSTDPNIRSLAQVGQIRVMLELSLSYTHLAEISEFLLPQWLEYEKSRPNSAGHGVYYDLISSLSRTDMSHPQNSKKPENPYSNPKIAHLINWLNFTTDELPARDFKIKASYKKWRRFAKAIHDGDLKSAKQLISGLNTSGFILTSKGDSGMPSLKVYDPRAPNTLSQFYAALVLESCETVTFGSYYCGRAHERLGNRVAAHKSYKAATVQLSTMLTAQNDETHLHTHHVLLSPHLTLEGFSTELKTRLKLLSDSTTETERSEATEPSFSTMKTVWSLLLRPHSSALPPIFPERRRELGSMIVAALDEAKGKDLDYVASLSLSDRWLDELHYLYAVELVKRDDRVRALKTLNAAEEAKAGARLQGRNRLPRLLLNAYNQLKMARFRVGAKYFQRLKQKLPALSLSLMMTSDILSGKSFEQQGSRANAGQ